LQRWSQIKEAYRKKKRYYLKVFFNLGSMDQFYWEKNFGIVGGRNSKTVCHLFPKREGFTTENFLLLATPVFGQDKGEIK